MPARSPWTPLSAGLDRDFQPCRSGSALMGAFGALAVLAAAVGLSGLLAYGVSLRRREIGVRLALGASEVEILRLFARQVMAVVGVGTAVGFFLAVAGAPLVRVLLFRTSPHDLTVFGIVALTLCAVAFAASLPPAWTPSRVPPAEALRPE